MEQRFLEAAKDSRLTAEDIEKIHEIINSDWWEGKRGWGDKIDDEECREARRMTRGGDRPKDVAESLGRCVGAIRTHVTGRCGHEGSDTDVRRRGNA